MSGDSTSLVSSSSSFTATIAFDVFATDVVVIVGSNSRVDRVDGSLSLSPTSSIVVQKAPIDVTGWYLLWWGWRGCCTAREAGLL